MADVRRIDPRIVRATENPGDLPAILIGEDWVRLTPQDCGVVGMASHSMVALILAAGTSVAGGVTRKMGSVVAVVSSVRLARRIRAAIGAGTAVVLIKIGPDDKVFLEPDEGWGSNWIPADPGDPGGLPTLPPSAVPS